MGGWIGTAQHSAFKTRRGTPMYCDVYLVGIRVWATGSRSDHVLGYFIDLFPAAISTGIPDYSPVDGCLRDRLCPQAHPIPHTVCAAGLSPLGLSLRLLQLGRVRLALEGSAGALWFSRPVPDPDAARFNFTAAGGAALEVAIMHDRALCIKYLYHHTSNGGDAIVNPGMNSEVVAIGMTWRRN